MASRVKSSSSGATPPPSNYQRSRERLAAISTNRLSTAQLSRVRDVITRTPSLPDDRSQTKTGSRVRSYTPAASRSTPERERRNAWDRSAHLGINFHYVRRSTSSRDLTEDPQKKPTSPRSPHSANSTQPATPLSTVSPVGTPRSPRFPPPPYQEERSTPTSPKRLAENNDLNIAQIDALCHAVENHCMNTFANQEDPAKKLEYNRALTTILSLHNRTAKVQKLGEILKNYHQQCNETPDVPVPAAEMRTAKGPLRATEVRAA
ncbi:MAG TPA: hypothetical protein VLE95_08495, partial [Chlamydiales bacterium]|nr:hypothetical protein [Chlamydiales bacterium]